MDRGRGGEDSDTGPSLACSLIRPLAGGWLPLRAMLSVLERLGRWFVAVPLQGRRKAPGTPVQPLACWLAGWLNACCLLLLVRCFPSLACCGESRWQAPGRGAGPPRGHTRILRLVTDTRSNCCSPAHARSRG